MSVDGLQASPQPLADRYDVALLDLDGVVYVGSEPIPGVSRVIRTATQLGMRFGYVTNNASRSPAQVGDHLRRLGIAASDQEVITSAQAASRVLAARLPSDSAVLVIGTAALGDEVQAVGLRAVWSAADDPAAVVQGYSPETSWRTLAEACVAVRGGALWVATNTDMTLPSPRGPLPGNGSFVQVVATASGAAPVVAGKPEPAMHAECMLRTGAQRPLVVGDRLDTDIEGAHRAGVPSLLVLTGLARPADLVAAPARQRPTYLAADLGGLLVGHPEVDRTGHGARCGDWQVSHREQELLLAFVGEGGPVDPGGSAYSDVDCDALRALAVMAWEHGTTQTAAGDVAAAAMLTHLELSAGLISRWPGREGSDSGATKGWTVVKDGFGTVAEIVKEVAQRALRGSRRALKATAQGIRTHAPQSWGLSRPPRRTSTGANPAPTPFRPAAAPVAVRPSPESGAKQAASTGAPAPAPEPAPATHAPAELAAAQGIPAKKAAAKTAAPKRASPKKAPPPTRNRPEKVAKTAAKTAPAKTATARTAKKAAPKKVSPTKQATAAKAVPLKKTTAQKARPAKDVDRGAAVDDASGTTTP